MKAGSWKLPCLCGQQTGGELNVDNWSKEVLRSATQSCLCESKRAELGARSLYDMIVYVISHYIMLYYFVSPHHS